MPTYQEIPRDWNKEFEALTPEAQAYIKQLEQESEILRHFQCHNSYDFLTCQSEAFMSLFASQLPCDPDTYHNVFRTTMLVTRQAMEYFESCQLIIDIHDQNLNQ